MKIKLITVGKIKAGIWSAAETEYSKRIERYSVLEQIMVKDALPKSYSSDDEIRRAESEEISKRIKDGEFVIALDKNGVQLSSQKLAGLLQEKMLDATKKLTFVIGGPLGLSEAFVKKADFALSFSQMTLPHELAKVVLLEQVYRAFTIINGEKYHK